MKVSSPYLRSLNDDEIIHTGETRLHSPAQTWNIWHCPQKKSDLHTHQLYQILYVCYGRVVTSISAIRVLPSYLSRRSSSEESLEFHRRSISLRVTWF